MLLIATAPVAKSLVRDTCYNHTMRSLFWAFLVILSFAPVFSVQAEDRTIKILLVPGHDAKSPGAIYGNIKEKDMNLVLVNLIKYSLEKDGRFDAHITQNSTGYTKEFADFFKTQEKNIEIFMESSKANMQSHLASGSFVKKINTPHGLASEDTAFKLYGINKWANTNDVDAVIHIHFNDYKRKTKWTVGDREGFAIYVPDAQFVNGSNSKALAESIFTQLKKEYKVSNYYKEMGGVVEDQKLIAVGSNRTLISTVRSVLVEYGYIYEFRDTEIRQKAYAKMSELTVEALQNYFFPG